MNESGIFITGAGKSSTEALSMLEKTGADGAMGYLYRNVTHPKVIRDCITSVYEGKSFFN